MGNLEQKIFDDFVRRGSDYIDDEKDERQVRISMTEKMYQDFEVIYKTYEEEYYRLRDELVNEYETMVSDFIVSYSNAYNRNEEEFGKELRSNIPSKEQFAESFKITLDRTPFTFDAEDTQKEYVGKVLRDAFGLAKYLGKYTTAEYLLSNEAVTKLKGDIRLLDEINVTGEKAVEDIIEYFRQIEDAIYEGTYLKFRSIDILKLIKQKVVKLAVEKDLLDLIDL